MKKAKRVLLVSTLIFIILLVYYVSLDISGRPETVSQREKYQQEMLEKEEGYRP